MTDEELSISDATLIARLREIQGQAGLFASAAADRIEALVKDNRELVLQGLADSGQAQEAYEAQLKAEARAERLEAALREIGDGYGPNHLSKFARDTARAALTQKEPTNDE